jgi:hypothetical protein
MAMTSRGRTTLGIVAAVVVIAVVAGVVLLGGGSGNGDERSSGGGSGPGAPSSSPRPTLCPLTGAKPPHGQVPLRPVLAVKVENLPEARPQIGLSFADVIYEEPVEANITRFIALYQCQDAERIEPIRSARLTDPPILVQYGRPLFAFAGAVQEVIKAVDQAGLVDVNYLRAPQAYHRDPNRAAPHNLYSSTAALYAAGGKAAKAGPPEPVFTHSASVPATAKRATVAHVPFSGYSDVYWRWNAGRHLWMRSYGTVPATYSDGTQMGAANVVIQMVKIVMTGITDANGVHSPEVVSTGSGPCWVLRDGRTIKGTWSRRSEGAVTVFRDASGNEIPLAPGKTWVELVPNTTKVTVG